jgi:hypothetical protein
LYINPINKAYIQSLCHVCLLENIFYFVKYFPNFFILGYIVEK